MLPVFLIEFSASLSGIGQIVLMTRNVDSAFRIFLESVEHEYKTDRVNTAPGAAGSTAVARGGLQDWPDTNDERDVSVSDRVWAITQLSEVPVPSNSGSVLMYPEFFQIKTCHKAYLLSQWPVVPLGSG